MVDSEQEELNYVIWGRNPVMEALRSGQQLEKVLVAHDSHPPKALLELVNTQQVKLSRVPRRRIEELAGTKKTQGVAALVTPVRYVPWDDLMANVLAERGILLVLDHITDPQNTGGLIRTAEVLGCVGVLTPRERSCPLNDVVVKASAGALFHLPVCRTNSLHASLKSFSDAGGWIMALEKGGAPLHTLNLPFPLALIAGAEGRGVSRTLLKMAQIQAEIPMRGKVTSLNVAAATAIALAEVTRQRFSES